MLYEMIAGRLPFAGERQEAVLYGITSEEPEPVTAQRAGLPLELEWIIGKALAKDREERYQHAEDLLVDLRGLQKKLASGSSTILKTQAASQTGGAPPRSAEQIERQYRRKQTLLLGAAVLGVLLALVFAFFPLFSPSPATDAGVVRFSISPENLTGGGISPDGKYILYGTNTEGESVLWLRPLDSEAPRKLEGTEGAQSSGWSPDSKNIVFGTDSELKRISIAGGQPITLCPLPGDRFAGASWSPDGDRIVFSSGLRMYEIAARGGEPKLLPDTNPGRRRYSSTPHFLPAGAAPQRLLETSGGASNFKVVLLDLETGEHRELAPGEGAVYSSSGHLIYHSDDFGLRALPFSIEDLTVTGEAFPIEENGRWASVSADGTLVYNGAQGSRQTQLVWKDRSGTTVGTIGEPQIAILTPNLSPGDRSVAAWGIEEGAGDIWVHEVQRPVKTRLTIDESRDGHPTWLPTGDVIAFSSSRLGPSRQLFQRRVDGSSPAEPLLESDQSVNRWLTDWSNDGRLALFYQRAVSGVNIHDLWYLERRKDDRGYEAVPFLQTRFREITAEFSPDEKWVVYASDESGRYEVYVRSFPDGGNKHQVSIDGGWRPRWSEESGEIFYVKASTLMAVRVSTNPTLTIGKPQSLFSSEQLGFWSGIPTYDVTSDGQRFVVPERAQAAVAGTDGQDGDPPRPSIRVVQNWYQEFRRRKQD